MKRLVSSNSGTLLGGRLSELEREELVNKKYIPPRVSIVSLTQAKELEVILIELGRWATRWKGAKSLPKLTAKNVKNLLPLISSIWNKKLVFHHELLILVLKVRLRLKNVNNRLNEIEHETALGNTQ